MKRLLPSCLTVLLLSACATPQPKPLPDGYADARQVENRVHASLQKRFDVLDAKSALMRDTRQANACLLPATGKMGKYTSIPSEWQAASKTHPGSELNEAETRQMMRLGDSGRIPPAAASSDNTLPLIPRQMNTPTTAFSHPNLFVRPGKPAALPVPLSSDKIKGFTVGSRSAELVKQSIVRASLDGEVSARRTTMAKMDAQAQEDYRRQHAVLSQTMVRLDIRGSVVDVLSDVGGRAGYQVVFAADFPNEAKNKILTLNMSAEQTVAKTFREILNGLQGLQHEGKNVFKGKLNAVPEIVDGKRMLTVVVGR